MCLKGSFLPRLDLPICYNKFKEERAKYSYNQTDILALMCYQKADTVNRHMNNSKKENILGDCIKNGFSLHTQFYTIHVSNYMKNKTKYIKPEEYVNCNYQQHIMAQMKRNCLRDENVKGFFKTEEFFRLLMTIIREGISMLLQVERGSESKLHC